MAECNVDDVIKSIFDNAESNLWSPLEKIPLINKEIEQLKLDMKNVLSESEYNIPELIDESKVLCEEAKEFIEEMVNCKKEVEEETMAEILKSIESHDLIAKELETVKFTLNVVYDVVQCGKYIKEYEECMKNERYNRAVEALTDLTDFLNNPVDGYNQLTMYTNLKSSVSTYREQLLETLNQEWDALISWSVNEADNQNTVNLKITFDDSLDTADILQALAHSKYLDVKLKEFASFLYEQVLMPIIHYECTVYAENDEDIIITIVLDTKEKPAYDAVIANLRLLFHFLSNRLNINSITYRDTLMSLLGKEISANFGEVLIKECLIETIPNSINELQTYGRITSEIEDFQRFMVMVKFFPDKDFSILHYINNIDELFATKSSQYFLEMARTIMLKDLSITMSIGVETVPDNYDAKLDCADESTEEALKVFDEALPKSLFYFPRCMISKSAQELVDLVYMLMEQAIQCSDLVCKRFYVAARLVFELYDAVVPYHHENYLLTIPQYVALFHNNCMYLAHNLLTIGEKWLTLMEGRDVNYPISFLDLVQKLRDLGYKHLTVHMQQQRKQILDNIRSSDLNCIVVKDVLSENAEQAIRQCLRQMQLLKNVWIGVFPLNVFSRLMATLINMFVDELIHRVCTVEDISAEMATQLSEIYSIVVKKAPNHFQNPTDIEVYVKSWIKLQEVILVLGGSLKDIEKRWCDGSGPLAVHFRAEELRNLVKALFQNTQFRANLLSKIK